MTTIVERVHFQELAEMDPVQVCRRALCRYDGDQGGYILPLWGSEVTIYPREQRVEAAAGSHVLDHGYWPLFAVHYLLTACDRPVAGEWVSEKDIPGGEGFFRGPHLLPTADVGLVCDRDTQGV